MRGTFPFLLLYMVIPVILLYLYHPHSLACLLSAGSLFHILPTLYLELAHILFIVQEGNELQLAPTVPQLPSTSISYTLSWKIHSTHLWGRYGYSSFWRCSIGIHNFNYKDQSGNGKMEPCVSYPFWQVIFLCLIFLNCKVGINRS